MEEAISETGPAGEPAGRSFWVPSVFGVTMVTILLVTTFLLTIKADDIWWHLKTGQYILNMLSLPEENIFSFTSPHHEWLPHEWLSEVVFYWLYHHLGALGLIAFGIATNAVACALVYKLTVRYSRSPYVSSLITLLAALMMMGNFSLRPYLFGNIFFVATLHAMEEPSAGGRLRPVLVFLLFAGWANFHGSFIIGLALILLYFAATLSSRWLEGRATLRSAKSYLFDFGVALVACVVTPNHVFGLIFPLIYVQKAFSSNVNYLTNISEWQPAGLSTPLGQMITFYLLFCGFALAGSRRSPRPIHIGLLVAFATFAYSSIRNIPLLGIAATPVLARHLPPALGRAWHAITSRTRLYKLSEQLHDRSISIDGRSRGLLLPSVAAALLAVVFMLPATVPASYTALTGVASLSDLSARFYPGSLMDKLEEKGGDLRVFNYFNWGGAFIWRLYPRIKVFIDQRNDCYPMQVFRDYFAVHRLERDWREVLDRWKVDAVAYPRHARLTEALRTEKGWQVVFDGDDGVLFERTSDVNSEISDH